MPFFPLPAAHFRGSSFQVAGLADFSDASSVTPNYATGKWTIATLSNVDSAQLDPLATAIEKLIQQDFASPEDDGQRVINAAGSSASFVVSLTQTAAGDGPENIVIGALTWSYGKAASLAALIRSLGFGAVWVP